MQSLGLGLDQKGLVLVLGNFWSLGLGLETKSLIGLGRSYLHLRVKVNSSVNVMV